MRKDLQNNNKAYKFNQMKDKFEEKNGKQYTEHICEYLNKYDEILYKKRPRKI